MDCLSSHFLLGMKCEVKITLINVMIERIEFL